MIGDLVRFVDIEEREIKITGRIKQFLSLCGEHLSLDNINTAIQNVCKSEGIEIPEFSLYAENLNQRHASFLGSDDALDPNKIMNLVDLELCKLNDDYASARKFNLKHPTIKVLPVHTFYNFMDSIGKSGAQNKVPRVMNEQQSGAWLKHLFKAGLN